MKTLCLGIIVLSFSYLSACDTKHSTAHFASDVKTKQQGETFSASAAWTEFEDGFRLFYAYIDRDDFDVEGAIARTRNNALSAENPVQFRRAILPLLYAFTDPHLQLSPLEDRDFNVIPTSADMWISYDDGKYVIIDVRRGGAALKTGIRPGDILLEISGTPIDEAVTGVFSSILDTPTVRQKSYGANLLTSGRRGASRSMRIKTASGEQSLTLPNPRDFARTVARLEPVSVRMGGDQAIITINNSLGDNLTISAFDKAMETASAAEFLILDLRNTPSGGNTEVARAIIGHFIQKPRPYQTHTIPSLEREFGVPRQFTEYALPRVPYFDPAKTVVIGGRWTGSMGEGLIIGLDAAAGMTTICSDMGDLLGGLYTIDLEQSGLSLSLGREALFHIDGTPREDYECDIPLEQADSDMNGGDPTIEKAAKLRR